MKYPIDAEKYIAAMRIEFGENPVSERLHRETFIPLVNDFYSDGFHEKGNHLRDSDTVLADFVQSRGLNNLSADARKTCRILIEWCNTAFTIGIQDARASARKENYIA